MRSQDMTIWTLCLSFNIKRKETYMANLEKSFIQYGSHHGKGNKRTRTFEFD